MAPIKFENDFKEKLDKRTIAPSKNAWNKLSQKLDTEDKSTSSKGFWWIGVAASVVGILLVLSQIFNNDIETSIPKIGDTPEAIKNPEKQLTLPELKLEEPETKVALENANQNEVNNKSAAHLILDTTQLKSNTYPVQVATVDTVKNVREEKDVTQAKPIEIASIETEKAQEVADAIYALSERESGVSNAAIDSLLKAAQKEILLSRMKNENKALVDAALLLQEVELELDQSFRDKVFKALKDSYGSVKTAIAQRND